MLVWDTIFLKINLILNITTNVRVAVVAHGLTKYLEFQIEHHLDCFYDFTADHQGNLDIDGQIILKWIHFNPFPPLQFLLGAVDLSNKLRKTLYGENSMLNDG
jgi:hypothetical protein